MRLCVVARESQSIHLLVVHFIHFKPKVAITKVISCYNDDVLSIKTLAIGGNRTRTAR